MTTIYKAQPVSDEEIPHINLQITQSVPNFENSHNNSTYKQRMENFYETQANLIDQQFLQYLPQGTKHALLILLLKQKHSLLVVK